MAEVFGSDEAEGEAPSAAGETGSAATSVALDRLRRKKRGGADEAEQRFLAEQSALVADQREHLREQMRHMRLKHFGERLRVTIQLMTILVGVAVAAVLGWTAWDASRADGIVIKPFTVPPALSARGVTGETVASKVMDSLSAMAEIARPSERQKSVNADWGQHIAIEIPETGVSLSQVDQWLREKLGHQRRITGELSLNPDGTLTLGARIGAHPLPAQTGGEADLDKMETKIAEAIYGREQPISMYQYLGNQGRWQEALDASLVGARAATTPEKRAMALNGVGLALQNLQGDLAAKAVYERALALTPNINHFVPGNLAQIEHELGHTERSVALERLALARQHASETETPEALRTSGLVHQANIAAAFGDFGEALRDEIAVSQTNMSGFVGESLADLPIALTRSGLHDTHAAAASLQAFEPRAARAAVVKATFLARDYAAAEDWAKVVPQTDQALALLATTSDQGVAWSLELNSLKAAALARLGRVPEAQQLAASLPLDCDFCLLARAMVADAAGDARAADRWFAEAARLTPSLPAANQAWGRALLARGDAKGALTRFDAAHAKGPRFADAIEGRGEALLALGDAKAAAGFAEAARLTPRWGRLHLKWGEALAKQGRAADAKAQFALAAGLDLTPAERAELSRVRA